MKLSLILLAATAYGQTLATTGQTMVRFQSIAHNGSYTVVATDMGQQLTANTSVAWAIPQAGTTGFEADKYVYLNNVGTGVITLTPVTSTLTGCGVTAATAITVAAYSSMRILSSGGNYIADMCGGSGGSNPTGSAGYPYWTGFAWSGTNTPSSGNSAYLFADGAAVATGGSTANAQVVTLSACPAGVFLGMTVRWVPSASNTITTPTLNVCSFGAKTVTKLGTSALANGDYASTAVANAFWDGTGFELQNPLTAASGGGVTSFSSGNLSPLFTTSVATATTTPALSFALSNFAADSIFGNFTGSSAAPSTQAIPACPNDGAHALVYVSHVLTCESVTGGGGGGLNGTNVQTVNYTAVVGDNGKLISMNVTGGGTLTLPATPPSATWAIFVNNLSTSGSLTVAGNGNSINGAGNLYLQEGQGGWIFTDGATSYFTQAPVTAALGVQCTYSGLSTACGTDSAVIPTLQANNVFTGTQQIAATSTNPTCSATGDIGKFWFDNTTSTTGFKVCKSVSGTVGWSLVTTVP